ncbi:hypothetical protein [Stenotrophobium rhamnosiphilum]|uniref:Secreted protein n=1 Tax=Stenotrophobium rhamnosiphilum TaxID=2029166 RepID=A0A2T5MJB4_9GAMM|nr:hypothetical protein [Stenotrophobium rhamnosiphilum]PTU32673.1 hypothetical protein CJD38_00675 [Stenotrophobium rhamnosiphilum]
MLKLMLRAGLMLATLGATGVVQAGGYPNSGMVIGAAQLADQSILVLPLPNLTAANSLLVQLGLQKISQPAIYVAPGASKAVAISLDCAQTELTGSPPYSLFQQFVASGKGSDGVTYGIHMTGFQLESGGYFPGYPFSYLVLSPAMRVNLPASVVSAVSLVDLQLMTVYGRLAYLGAEQIGQSASVNVTVSTHVAATRTKTNSCGVLYGSSDPWVQTGLFALVGTSLP